MKMQFFKRIYLFLLFLLFQPASALALDQMVQPKVVLWAWERNEDLRYINPETTGIAFLANRILIKGERFYSHPRSQSLKIPEKVWLEAVVRIHVVGLSRAIPLRLVPDMADDIIRFARLAGISSLQLDFDATYSQRAFYKALLLEIRKKMGNEYPVSITALASWCVHDDWLKTLPIQQAVPMFFRMGDERPLFVQHLKNGHLIPVCRQSLGISLDEPIERLPESRSLYIFNPHAWTESDVDKIYAEAQR